MEVPTALLTRNATPQREILAVGAGFSPAFPAWTLLPRMAQSSMFPGLAGNIELNSISRGRAYITWVLLGGKACAHINGYGWSFVTFSTTPGPGYPAGSIYDHEGAGVGSAIYSYFVPGSEPIIPVEYVGRVQKARTGSEMGVDNVTGLDSYAYATFLNQLVTGPTPSSPSEESVTYFFTLTSASLAMIPKLPAPGGWCTQSQARTDTIFRIDWDTQSGTWLTPTVFMEAVDLFGESSATEVAIDALTVDLERQCLLLSTDQFTLQRELWFVSWLPSLMHRGPYYNRTGSDFYIRDYLGLTPNSSQSTQGLDGLCGDDPSLDLPYSNHSRDMWRRQLTAMPVYPQIDKYPYDLSWSAHLVRLGKKDYFQFHARPGPLQDTEVLRLMLETGGPPIMVATFTAGSFGSGRPITVNYSRGNLTGLGNVRFYWRRDGGGKAMETRRHQFYIF